MKKQPASPVPPEKAAKKPGDTKNVQNKTGTPGRENNVIDWEAVFRAIGSPAIIVAPDHTILSANDATCRMTGKTGPELHGMKCWEIFHGPGVTDPPKGCPMVALLSSGRYEIAEMEVSTVSGVCLVSCTPVFDAAGAISSVIHIATDITEKKKAELQLQESEERFRKIFENSPLGMALVTPDFRFFSVNPAWVSMTGFTEKELLGMSFTDITHPDYLAGDVENIRNLAAGTIPFYSTEKRYIRKDGSILRGLLEVTAIRDPEGSLRHFAAQIDDITLRRQAEQDLLQKNRTLETINQLAIEFASLSRDKSVPDLAVKKLMQLSGVVMATFSLYNPADRTLQVTHFGIAPGLLEKTIRLLGKRPGEVKIPISPVMYEDIVSHTVGTKKTLTEVCFGAVPPLVGSSIQKMTGIDHFIGIAHVVEGELYGTSMLAMKPGRTDPPAELLDSFAHIVAVSLRRYRAEAVLAESEEKYHNLYRNSAIGIFHSSFEGRFIDVNPALAKMLGYDSPEEVVTSVTDLARQVYDTPPQYDVVTASVLDAGGILSIENRYRRRDGTPWYGMLHVRIVPDPQGRPGQYEGFVEDITGRKQAEEQRERLVCELAQKNEELDRFTYTVSHDLKSPLLSIRAFASLLERDLKSGDSGKIQRDIFHINESTEKLENLINTLLALSRSGKAVDTPVRIPFSDLAREAAGLLDPTLRERGVILEISDTMPVIYGDRQRFLQVMTNLLDNAVKFMGDQKEPRIEITTRAGTGSPVYCVRDNGMGIRPENLEKIFGLFERFDPDVPGTGIGLSTVKRIIGAHGGKIWVESDGPGKGTTVCFTLPVPGNTGTDKDNNR